MKTEAIKKQLSDTTALTKKLAGHLTEREARFLSILPFLDNDGEILEIGSFKGKSTIILAKSVIASGGGKVNACDPLSLACRTDPTMANKEQLPSIFRDNLKQHGVDGFVDFHQMKSTELAKTWDKPLKILWIDGDHTYDGALADIESFQKHLVPGAIVCFHDVLHSHSGPVRVFIEKMLLSSSFGECGLCGSIGWGQYLGQQAVSQTQWQSKLSLYRKMSKLVPFVIRHDNKLKHNNFMYKLYRNRVPHGDINHAQWIADRNNWQTSS